MHCTIYIIFFALCISGFGEFKWVPRDRNGILHCVVEEETRQKIVRVSDHVEAQLDGDNREQAQEGQADAET